MTPVTCRECRDIADEIVRSYQEMWGAADRSFRDAWEARNRLIGGTEEDVLRAEELFGKANMKAAPAIGRVILRKFAHEAVTGHKVPKPPFPL